MATHSSIPAWKIPWTEKPGRLQSTGCKELDRTEHTKTQTGTLLCPRMPLRTHKVLVKHCNALSIKATSLSEINQTVLETLLPGYRENMMYFILQK